MCYPLSSVWLFAIPWTVAHQALLSMGFSRQEYWRVLPCTPPGDLPDAGIKTCLLCLLYWQACSLPLWSLPVLPYKFLPLAEFNWYHFIIMLCKCKYIAFIEPCELFQWTIKPVNYGCWDSQICSQLIWSESDPEMPHPQSWGWNESCGDSSLSLVS